MLFDESSNGIDDPSYCLSCGKPPGAQPETRARWLEREILPHEKALWTMIRQRYPDFDGNDVIQATYVRLMRAPRIDHVTNPKQYLFRSAISVIRDMVRRNQVRPVAAVDIDDCELELDEPSADRIIDSRRELQHIWAVLQQLPPRQRMVIELKRFEKLSTRAIAERMGKSVRSVEFYHTAAMRQLTAALDELRKRQSA